MSYTKNFIASIRPKSLKLKLPSGQELVVLAWYPYPTVRFMVQRTQVALVTCEREMWSTLVRLAPDALYQLSQSESLIDRALAQRGEFILGSSDEMIDRENAALERQTRQILDVVMLAMNATPATRTPLRLRRTAKTQSVSFWEYRTLVVAPHLSKRDYLTVRMFPSPYREQHWMLRVRMEARTDAATLHHQAAIRNAIATLAEQGITIEDVTSFTTLEL